MGNNEVYFFKKSFMSGYSLKTDFKNFSQGVTQLLTYPETIDYYQQKGEPTDEINLSQYPMKIVFEFGNNYFQSTHEAGKEVFRYVYIGDINYNADGTVGASILNEGAVIFSDLETKDSYGYIVSPQTPVAFDDTSSFLSFDLSIQQLFDRSNIIHEHELSNGVPTTVSGSGYEAFKSSPYTNFYPDNWEVNVFESVSTVELGNSIGRLYTAAFGRVPDEGGLQYWINVVSDPLVNYKDVSQNFVDSPEFSTIALPNASSDVFATALYQNVLGRAPDAPGLSWWTNQLNSGLQDRADVLMGFADSPENVALYEKLA